MNDDCKKYPRLELSPEREEQLISAAKSAMQFAFDPYLPFKIGAAVLTMDGELMLSSFKDASWLGSPLSVC